MVGTIQSTRKPAVQPGLFQSMASCMNRTFVVQMKAFQRNKPQSMEEPQFYGDYVLLTFPLHDPYDLEEVMDMLEDDMELIVLYHHIPMQDEPFGHSTCAYSNPSFGQMFKVNAKTDSDGKVHTVLVTIYDSLEQMYGDLCLDLQLHSKSGKLKYQKNKEDILIDFL